MPASQAIVKKNESWTKAHKVTAHIKQVIMTVVTLCSIYWKPCTLLFRFYSGVIIKWHSAKAKHVVHTQYGSQWQSSGCYLAFEAFSTHNGTVHSLEAMAAEAAWLVWHTRWPEICSSIEFQGELQFSLHSLVHYNLLHFNVFLCTISWCSATGLVIKVLRYETVHIFLAH